MVEDQLYCQFNSCMHIAMKHCDPSCRCTMDRVECVCVECVCVECVCVCAFIVYMFYMYSIGMGCGASRDSTELC